MIYCLLALFATCIGVWFFLSSWFTFTPAFISYSTESSLPPLTA